MQDPSGDVLCVVCQPGMASSNPTKEIKKEEPISIPNKMEEDDDEEDDLSVDANTLLERNSKENQNGFQNSKAPETSSAPKKLSTSEVSDLLGKRLLMGWTMLQDCCPNSTCIGVAFPFQFNSLLY